MLVGAGAKFHFLDGDDDLLLFRLVCFLLGFVLKLAEVDDFANRRLSVGRDFDQVHAFLAGSANRFARVHDAQRFALIGDDAHLRYANSFVYSSYRRAPKIGAATSTKTCSYCCTSSVLVQSLEDF